jgi:KaiC/GvpD/RAD55 family RecA-like ATPase
MKLKKTGISGLDEFLGGGLPPTVVLLLGSTDKGSETFARQVALFRSKERGITYFTVSKTPESIKNDMSAYNLDISLQEKAGKWEFINLNTISGSPKDAIIGEMKKNRCVVLDSLSELLLDYNRKDIFDLVSAMNKQNNETKELHFILLTKGMQDPKIEIAMQHFADGVIDFETTWEAEGLTRKLMIRNMSGIIIPVYRLQYSIGDRGFTIETATRIT